MSRVNAIFHIVINTHNRQMTIRNDHREDLYRYIWKIINNNDCVLPHQRIAQSLAYTVGFETNIGTF